MGDPVRGDRFVGVSPRWSLGWIMLYNREERRANTGTGLALTHTSSAHRTLSLGTSPLPPPPFFAYLHNLHRFVWQAVGVAGHQCQVLLDGLEVRHVPQQGQL